MHPDPTIPSPFTCLWPKEREERWAATHSAVTRLFGWSLVAGCVAIAVLNLLSKHLDLGVVLFFFAGVAVKRGSQGWLRFAVFICGLSALVGLGSIAFSLLKGEPFVLEGRPRTWIDYRDEQFWLFLVSPTIFLLGQAMLGALCLRTRNLNFWTRPARIWTWIVGVVITVALGTSVWNGIQTASIKRRAYAAAGTELAMLKGLIRTHGTGALRSAPAGSTAPFFGDNPRIRRISWKPSPNSTAILFVRSMEDHPTGSDDRTATTLEHEEFIRLPGGTWCLLILEFTEPG